MPVFQLDQRIVFPDPRLADDDGLLAIGGDLCPPRLLLAYASGIFPWPSKGLPLLWHSPDPRFVLLSEELHVPRSLGKVLRRERFHCTLDRAFERVTQACAERQRPGQKGTWITDPMREAYNELHRLGFAHSVEVWQGEELVGGLYGVSLGAAFFGESMFALVADASKVGFVRLVSQLKQWGVKLVDAQVHTAHLERFGARYWSRDDYLNGLKEALEHPTRRGQWCFDAQLC
jgi:leucyl/phenylalanyl-tRNA---protein transferase